MERLSSSEGRAKKVSIIGPPHRRSAMDSKETSSIKRPADTTEEEDARKGKKKRGKVWNSEGKVRGRVMFMFFFYCFWRFLGRLRRD